MNENMTEQPNMNDLITNMKSEISQALDQRLSPLEQRLNQPTHEQIEEMKYQRKQLFDEDPIAYENSIREQTKKDVLTELAPALKKIKQMDSKLTWEGAVNQFRQRNPDAEKYLPDITRTFQEIPGLLDSKNPLDAAYKLVLSNNLLGNGGNIIDGIMGNEEYKNQLLQNPQLKEAIIQEYQNGLNTGAQGLPPMMGSQGGTSIPASGGEQPRNLKESKQAALRRFQAMQG